MKLYSTFSKLAEYTLHRQNCKRIDMLYFVEYKLLTPSILACLVTVVPDVHLYQRSGVQLPA